MQKSHRVSSPDFYQSQVLHTYDICYYVLLWGNSKLDLVYISIDASVRIYVFQELLKENNL